MASSKKRSGNANSNAANSVSSAAKTTKTASTEFNPDYTYVKKDLSRIGILAGSFFVILVVLSFFLR